MNSKANLTLSDFCKVKHFINLRHSDMVYHSTTKITA